MGLPVPTLILRSFIQLITRTVTVTDPDFNFFNEIGNHFVTDGTQKKMLVLPGSDENTKFLSG